MSSRSATRRASPASTAEQQPFLLSRRLSVSWACAPVRMNRPTTSYPCSLSSTADAELSTPPDMASTTRPGMTSSQRIDDLTDGHGYRVVVQQPGTRMTRMTRICTDQSQYRSDLD